jgi:FMN phosphatase YigB (HAD superfamily)
MTTARTLLVDIGGTLLTRTRPGPVWRAQAALCELGVAVPDAAVRERLARCLLTGDDVATGSGRAAHEFGLTAGQARVLAAAIAEPEGEPMLLPGACGFLRQAMNTGWRVIAVTNTARWCSDIPLTLTGWLDDVVTSAATGYLKHDPRFWLRLREAGVDPAASLVVGDSPVPDGRIPARLGFCPVIVCGDGPSLIDLTWWLAAAADRPDSAIGAAAGRRATWAGHAIMPVPHLADLVVAVTRYRVRVWLPGGRAVTTTIVRRQREGPALLLPAMAGDGLCWLTPVADRRNGTVPADLASALQADGFSLDGLPDRERRHLVSMVREAKAPEVREMRVADVIAFLQASQAERGGRTDG